MPYIKLHPQQLCEYKLVYQGGHHNKYCNGTRHIGTDGGWARGKFAKVTMMISESSCDCAKWKEYNEKFNAVKRKDINGN